LIDNLEKRYGRRESDPADRRNNLIHLTPRGATLKQKTTDVVHSIVNHVLEGISDKELIGAKNVLLQIMHNLREY
jgi:DNA-binding MarR family transcriptional regulator